MNIRPKSSAFIWRAKHYGDIQKDGYLVAHKITEWCLCPQLTEWFMENTSLADENDYHMADFDVEDFQAWLKEELKHPEKYDDKTVAKMLAVQHDLEGVHDSFAFHYFYEQY